jgi:Cytochrome P450
MISSWACPISMQYAERHYGCKCLSFQVSSYSSLTKPDILLSRLFHDGMSCIGVLSPLISWCCSSALKDARVPLYKPIHGKDGQELHDLVIPEGTKIIVSIQGCNRAPDLWGADTLEFKPERWLNSIPQSVVDAKVPGVYSHL